MARAIIRLTQAALLLAAGIATDQPATAGPYTVSQQETGSPFGTPNWSEEATVSYDGGTSLLRAGMFRLHIDDGAGDAFDLAAFCIELDQFLNLPRTYAAHAYTPAHTASVNVLWLNAFGLVNDAQSVAAFQFSLWEITHDSGFDLTAGDLVIDGVDSTEALAQSWLDKVESRDWKPGQNIEFTAWRSNDSQDQLSARMDDPGPAAIPVPATGKMLLSLAAAGGIAGRLRRRT